MPDKQHHSKEPNGSSRHYNGKKGAEANTQPAPIKEPLKARMCKQASKFSDWHQIPLPIPNLTFDFEWKWPTVFDFLAPDEAAIAGVADESDATERATKIADSAFDKAHPHSEQDYDENEGRLEGQLSSHDVMAKDAETNQCRTDGTEEIETNEPKIENSHFPHFRYLVLSALLVFGSIMLIWTIFSLISASDKMPILYKYPAAAGVFALLPLGIMFLLAECYIWLKDQYFRAVYLVTLIALNFAVFIGWLLTLGPAYGDVPGNLDDLSVAAPFNWYILHITIQLAGEVLIGGLLKISLHIIDSKWRKTVAVETTRGQRTRADSAMIAAQHAPIQAELSALRKSRNARSAAKQLNREAHLAVLDRIRQNRRAQNEAAEAAATLARTNHKLTTSN